MLRARKKAKQKKSVIEAMRESVIQSGFDANSEVLDDGPGTLGFCAECSNRCAQGCYSGYCHSGCADGCSSGRA